MINIESTDLFRKNTDLEATVMNFNEINPFIRYIHYEAIDSNSNLKYRIPLDARLFFVLNGKCNIETYEKTYEMKPKSLLVINAGREYRLLPSAASARLLVVNYDYTNNSTLSASPVEPVFHESPQFSADFIYSETFEDLDCLNAAVYLDNMPSIEQKLIKLEAEYAKPQRYSQQLMSCLFLEILILLLRDYFDGDTFHNKNIVPEIIEYIHQHLSEPLGNKILAQTFCFNSNYLNDKFKKYTGVPLHKYILQAKLNRAISLIESGNLSITEVSEKCGFSSVYYFSRWFKKKTGITAQHYLLSHMEK